MKDFILQLFPPNSPDKYSIYLSLNIQELLFKSDISKSKCFFLIF